MRKTIIDSFLDKRAYRIKTLKIKLKHNCNLRCRMCDHWRGGGNIEEMSTEQVLKVLDEAASLGCRQITITGGEPTLRKDLEIIFTQARKNHMRIKLLTNGYKVPEKRLSSLVSSGLGKIGVSLDYPEAEEHDYIRGVQGAFQNTIEFIKRSVTFRRQISNLYEVIIATCLLKNNVKYLQDIIKLGKSLGVDGFSIITIDPHNDDGKNMDPTLQEKYVYQTQIIPSLTTMCKQFDCKLNTSGITANYGLSIDSELKNFPCYFTWANITIGTNGNVYPCCNLVNNPSVVMGNIKDASLKEILNSQQASKACSLACERKLSICKRCYWEHDFNLRVQKMHKNTLQLSN